MGLATLAMLAFFLGQAPGEVWHTNQRSLRIPINFQDARRSELRELLLFASADQGRNWQQVAAVLPDKTEFLFNAPAEGTWWLKVAVINRQGKQEPDNIQQGPPDLRIVVDTFKPLVQIASAQRQGDEVVVSWDVKEDNPDPKSLRLEYQPKDNPSAFWSAVPIVVPGPTGQVKFRPSSAGPLLLRLQVRDQAGNQGQATAEVGGTIATTSFTPPAGQGSTTGSPPPPAPPIGLVPNTPPNSGATTSMPPPLPPNPSPAAPVVPPPPLAVSNPAPVPPPQGAWTPGAAATPEANTKLVATSEPSNPAPVPASVARKPLPPLQYVNQPEVMLEYELAKVGPSGVGAVDLWWTQNDGQSWELYAVDPEIKGSTQNGRHQRTVELPGDGVYGFILVVKSRAGLGKAPPRAGDSPEIRIEVDTVAPVAQLYSPSPDPQRQNALLMKWAAKDNNLPANPITLEWSERRDGPWQAIAAHLPNTGRYSWQLPERLPVQVFLRLRVRDLAGNESVAVTPEPQLVDLSEPEGRLVNVSVVPRKQ